jgi:hypothetical protein
MRVAQWTAASQAKTAVEDYLRHGVPGNCKLEAAAEVEPKLNKGETVTDAIERLRRRGRELKAAIHTIRSSCFPSGYCKQRAREQVEQLSQRGAISVSRLVEFDGDIEFPSLQQRAMVHNATAGAVAFHETVDVVALMAFLHKPTLIAALDREIDAEADDKAALTHEQRQEREAVALADLLDIERQEASLTWSAIEQGLPIEFRADCDPRALLGVQLVTTRAGEAPRTTLGMAWDYFSGGRQ